MRLSVVPVALPVALFAALAAGCPEAPNSLDGSISESFSLEFDRTEMRRFGGVTLQLDYLRDIEGASIPDVVCKIVFDTPEGGVVAGEAIDIVANDGIIERIAVGGEDYPELELANITFDVGGNEPGPAAGSFVSTFENGKTLNGNFDTELEDVDF